MEGRPEVREKRGPPGLGLVEWAGNWSVGGDESFDLIGMSVKPVLKGGGQTHGQRRGR